MVMVMMVEMMLMHNSLVISDQYQQPQQRTGKSQEDSLNIHQPIEGGNVPFVQLLLLVCLFVHLFIVCQLIFQ